MADGRTRPLADIRVGDQVYGTVPEAGFRRYVVTTVLAHWETLKPAYRITLADGTELTASADHRYLTNRGWKYVTGATHGANRRPFLTTANKLMGTGKFAEPPKKCAEYRRGYLCGVFKGHGRGDARELDRARRYLEGFEVAGSRAEAIAELTAWPGLPADDWHKGFLAGVFDARGTGAGSIRIGSGDETTLGWMQASCAISGSGPCWSRRARPAGRRRSASSAGCPSGCASSTRSTPR
jgi:hypothetical protein